jgi:hypothetical protein
MFDETLPIHSLRNAHWAGQFPETWPKGV